MDRIDYRYDLSDNMMWFDHYDTIDGIYDWVWDMIAEYFTHE